MVSTLTQAMECVINPKYKFMGYMHHIACNCKDLGVGYRTLNSVQMERRRKVRTTHTRVPATERDRKRFSSEFSLCQTRVGLKHLWLQPPEKVLRLRLGNIIYLFLTGVPSGRKYKGRCKQHSRNPPTSAVGKQHPCNATEEKKSTPYNSI